MTALENPSAFPLSTLDGYVSDGMTLRDYFAGQVLGGMTSVILDDGDIVMGWAVMSRDAYNAADAMLAERAKATS